MADNIGNKAAHDYHLDIPQAQDGFYVKGAGHCDWGLQNRLGRMFDPKSGNTVMLAFDHGYIMGPTAGLERIDLVIPPLIPYVNVLMGTKGIIRSCISPADRVAKCVRVTYDSTVLFDDMSNGGGIACDMENAIRMNADCVAVQTFIGSAGESVAAGAIFTLPALFMWAREGRGEEPGLFTVGLIALCGGVLGVLLMIPLRRALIVKEHASLPYPEGRACAQVLLAGVQLIYYKFLQ